MGANGPASGLKNLKGPDDPVGVIGMESVGAVGVTPFSPIIQQVTTEFAGYISSALSTIGYYQSGLEYAMQQCFDIEPRSADHQRYAAPTVKF